MWVRDMSALSRFGRLVSFSPGSQNIITVSELDAVLKVVSVGPSILQHLALSYFLANKERLSLHMVHFNSGCPPL